MLGLKSTIPFLMLLMIIRLNSYLVPPNIRSFDPMRQQQCLRRGHGPWPETFRLTHTLVSNTKQQKRESLFTIIQACHKVN